MKAEKISKERIGQFQQVPIHGGSANGELRSKLETALKLGNTFKGKCNLVFNTTTGAKKVYTTIWNVTDKHVELKGGTILMISSIVDII